MNKELRVMTMVEIKDEVVRDGKKRLVCAESSCALAAQTSHKHNYWNKVYSGPERYIGAFIHQFQKSSRTLQVVNFQR
jgi:hypothetical protein